MRLVTLVAAMAATLALVSPASARTWAQSWDVTTRPTVVVETNDGHVRLHLGPPGHVNASIEYTVKIWGWHSDVSEPRVRLERDGDTIHVYARPHSNFVVFGGVDERFRIDVTLPAESDVRVRSGDGPVDVPAVIGQLDVHTGDGHILVQGARGDIRLRTSDGGIDAAGLDGSLTARTADGHLIVSGRFDHMEVRSSDGRVDATIQRGSALAGPWEFTSTDGGITLRIPRNLQALMDASTRDGRLRVELPITGHESMPRHWMRGQLNGGTVPLRVRTADGSIRFALSE